MPKPCDVELKTGVAELAGSKLWLCLFELMVIEPCLDAEELGVLKDWLRAIELDVSKLWLGSVVLNLTELDALIVVLVPIVQAVAAPSPSNVHLTGMLVFGQSRFVRD